MNEEKWPGIEVYDMFERKVNDTISTVLVLDDLHRNLFCGSELDSRSREYIEDHCRQFHQIIKNGIQEIKDEYSCCPGSGGAVDFLNEVYSHISGCGLNPIVDGLSEDNILLSDNKKNLLESVRSGAIAEYSNLALWWKDW